MKPKWTRRSFLATAAMAGVGMSSYRGRAFAVSPAKPALLGGQATCNGTWPSWPVIDQRDEKALLEVLHSGKWYCGDGKQVDRFEEAYAKLTGAKHCVATCNGTSALFASLGALGIGPGDEVILPPYTFVATLNAVMLQYALPVFVDTDPETFEIDARKIEAAITDSTALLLPVHIGGNAADMDAVLAVAGKHKLPVVEDACQAHLGQWRGHKLGTLGTTGCFSFQASKNLNSGEGGAVITDDAELAAKCYAFHNNGRAPQVASYNFTYHTARSSNLRMTEFQGSLLMAQMTRVRQQSNTRKENGDYLSTLLREIPGIAPAKMYDGCTHNAYHLFMFRYHAEPFAGLSRDRFLAALRAEGIPASGGYSPLNKAEFLAATLNSRSYRKIYGEKTIAEWAERNHCPENDRLCEEAVWFTQNMLLGPRSDMDRIAKAIRKIQTNAAALARA